MNDLVDELRKTFQDEEARYAYADSVVNAFVSAQIKALREDRDLSQEKLAEAIGTKQSGISRLERSDYSAWKIETLRRLARAFGVRLRISFEEFGTLPGDLGSFTKRKMLPRRFAEDPVFAAQVEVEGTKAQYQSSVFFGSGTAASMSASTQDPRKKLPSSAGHSSGDALRTGIRIVDQMDAR